MTFGAFGRPQHAWLALVVAAEAVAGFVQFVVGALFLLPCLGYLALGLRWLADEIRGKHSYQLHRHLDQFWNMSLLLAACTVLAPPLLWCGHALMRGRPHRYRAQGVVLVTALAVVVMGALARRL